MTISVPDKSQLGVILIDAQPFFIDVAFTNQDEEKESVILRLEHLLMLADWMDIPTLTTFERPVSYNGELPERLEAVYPKKGQRFEKDYFNLTAEGPIKEAIKAMPIKQIAVAGAETDVCVMQSVLGLLQMGYEVFLLEECLFTTEPHPKPALRRMESTGAIPTTLKTMAYELVKRVDNIPWHPEGYKNRKHIECKPFPEKFIPPEEWQAWHPKY